MYFVFYGLHDTTLQICIISLYECFAYDITVVVKINLFQCQCQCQMPALETLHFLSIVLSMLAFAVKYGTGCLYLNNCIHSLKSFLFLKLYNTMIVIVFSICRHW